MLKLISFSMIFLHIISFCSQSGKTIGNIHFPGERTAMDTAEIFCPGMVSTDSFEHSSPAFSSDGKNVLWSIVEMPSWKSRILEMNYEHGQWSAPHHPLFSDTSASDIYPSFSPDGKILYFSSNRKLPSGQFPSKGNVIWTVEKTETGWGVPKPLDRILSYGGSYSPTISNKGNLYFTYGPFRSPDWNILMVNLNTNHTVTIKLPASINTNGYEDGPFIAPDESYLIFESDRAGSIDGSIDLYISFKSKSGDWITPLNMGPRINSSASERFAHMSRDGKFLFFGSNRRTIMGIPNFDIYRINGSVIKILREQALEHDKRTD